MDPTTRARNAFVSRAARDAREPLLHASAAAVAARFAIDVPEAHGPVQGAFVTPTGVLFSVWAPYAGLRLDVRVNGELMPMTAVGNGFFQAHVRGAADGARYRYALPGGESPDIASLSQPDGILGDSQVVDLARLPRDTSGFRGIPLSQMVQEQFHVGLASGSGDFEGLKARLNERRALGINAAQLMPVNSFTGKRNVGYDNAYLRSIQESYGGVAQLKALIIHAHSIGTAVGLDLQFNHFPWEEDLYRNFGPYKGTSKTDWGDGINFDGVDSGPVRSYELDTLGYLFDPDHGLGIDFVRIDAFPHYTDRSAVHIGKAMADTVHAIAARTGKQLHLIVEDDLDRRPQLVHGVDAAWNDGIGQNAMAKLTGLKRDYLRDYGLDGQTERGLREGYVYQGEYSWWRSKKAGHPVHHGEPPTGLMPDQLVHFVFGNHDRTMNDNHGKSVLGSIKPHLRTVAAVLQGLSATVPMYAMGSSTGSTAPFYYVTDYQDPDKARAVDEGRDREHPRECGLPTPPRQSLESTYLRGKLPEADPASALLTQRILGLRRLHGIGAEWPVRVEGDRSGYVFQWEYPSLRITLNADTDRHGARRGLNGVALRPGQVEVCERIGDAWVPVAL